jgi:hypothetical protein
LAEDWRYLDRRSRQSQKEIDELADQDAHCVRLMSGVFGAIERELRRSAIEPVIGQLKTDGHLPSPGP